MPITTRSNIPDLVMASAKFRREVPIIIANNSKNHFLMGFRRGGGMTDGSLSGWARRKKQDKRRGNRALLVLSGQLRNDLDIRKTTINEIVLGTEDTIYASVHNNGEKAGRGAGFQMPKREFLGDSRKLDRKNGKLILKKLKLLYK